MDNARTFHPAEWQEHVATWTAYPCAADLWLDDLAAAQQEFLEMCRILGRTECLRILVPDDQAARAVKRDIGHTLVETFVLPYGDIWLRDTGPLWLRTRNGGLVAGCFRFNGWGEKYVFPGDATVAAAIARTQDAVLLPIDFVLEGGSIESDGEGTCLTSRQCLLNSNRNGSVTEQDVNAVLAQRLGAERTLWVSEGLQNDHTDGHIDTIARFVAPGHVVCMAPATTSDPNHRVLKQIAAELAVMHDAHDRRLKVTQVPSPGPIYNQAGEIMPASYLNFYIGNEVVVVPTYNSPQDELAVRAIAALFPTRRVVGSGAVAILTGGGAFHCMTQQQPL